LKKKRFEILFNGALSEGNGFRVDLFPLVDGVSITMSHEK